jgi:glycosyltransferase involved in cell wall biosynthesis
MLAGAFARAGHEVTVVTQSAGPDDAKRTFRVIRQPSIRELWSLYKWTEIVFQNNLSTRLLWPNLPLGKPCIVTTQTWLSGASDLNTRTSRLKRAILRRCRNVAISEAVAQHIGHPSIVLGNPYDAETFRRLPDVQRNEELLFVGRLVSDKGLDLLLGAMGCLRDTGVAPTLTVAGEGPGRAENEELVEKLGLGQWVKFVGVVRGTELARLMNAHRILSSHPVGRSRLASWRSRESRVDALWSARKRVACVSDRSMRLDGSQWRCSGADRNAASGADGSG